MCFYLEMTLMVLLLYVLLSTEEDFEKVGSYRAYRAICLKWNFLLGFLLFAESRPFFHIWLFHAGS